MPWTKKTAAPEYANLAETTEALITGGPNAWMLPWWYLVDNRVIDVNAFCGAGPEECEPFDLIDFASIAVSGGAAGLGLALLGMKGKINCFARNRLYSAYCEYVNPPDGSPGWHTVGTYSATRSADVWDYTALHLPLFPNWATQARLTITSGPNYHLGFVLCGSSYH